MTDSVLYRGTYVERFLTFLIICMLYPLRCAVFKSVKVEIDAKELKLCCSKCPVPISVRKLLQVIEMAKSTGKGKITAAGFVNCVVACGLRPFSLSLD